MLLMQQQLNLLMENKMKRLIIFGEYSTALEIREIAKNDYYVTNVKFEDNFLNSIKNYNEKETYYYIMSFSDYRLRQKCSEKIKQLPNFVLQSIIHSSAVIFNTAKIGSGTYIAATAVVSHNAIIEENCIINIAVSIGHDAIINTNTVLMPGVRIGGNCNIGKGCMIGTNSFIYQGIKIGNHTFVDAMTYINKNLPDKEMVRTNQNLRITKNIFFNEK
jgi:UDP-3-O-[3-hydroxymyristoyl] glucosamine N-acyltransferase